MQDSLGSFGVQTLLGEQAAILQTSALIEDAITVRGDRARFAAFTDIPALRSAVSVMDAWDGSPKTARAWSPSGGAPFQIFATREQLRTLYDAGFLIVLEDVERFVPALQPLCRALEKDLGLAPDRVNVEVFCALKGGLGRPHFDPSFTFNCQVSGTKTWKLARNPSLRFPPAGMFLGHDAPAEIQAYLEAPLPKTMDHAEVFVAGPGDVVFVAPGVLHETFMETESFAIAFAIEQTDTIAKKVASGVRRSLQKWPELRAARLGAQNQDIMKETQLVAHELRRLADQLEGKQAGSTGLSTAESGSNSGIK